MLTESLRFLRKVLVTGGTGLVGRALADLVTSDPQPEEEWVFLSSKDGDLWYVHTHTSVPHTHTHTHTYTEHELCWLLLLRWLECCPQRHGTDTGGV